MTTMSSVRPRMPPGSQRPGCPAGHGSARWSTTSPVAYPCAAAGGLHLDEDEFICELLDPHDGEPVAAGAQGELVVTALGRVGFPVIR